MDLKKICWRLLQALIVVLLNGCGIAIIIMLWMSPNLSKFKQDLANLGIQQNSDLYKLIMENAVKESFFEALPFLTKAGIIFGEILGAVISYKWTCFLYKEGRQDKRVEKLKKEVNNERFKNL